MPKICDPPPFKGGQCQVPYFVTLVYESNAGFGFGGIKYVGFGGDNSTGQNVPPNPLKGNQVDGAIKSGELVAFFPRFGIFSFKINLSNGSSVTRNFLYDAFGGATLFYARIYEVGRVDGLSDNCGDPPSDECRCSPDSCRVDCPSAQDGFCCIDHSLTDGLSTVLSLYIPKFN